MYDKSSARLGSPAGSAGGLLPNSPSDSRLGAASGAAWRNQMQRSGVRSHKEPRRCFLRRLLVHGTADTSVPSRSAVHFAAALQAAGVEAALKLYPGRAGSHGLPKAQRQGFSLARCRKEPHGPHPRGVSNRAKAKTCITIPRGPHCWQRSAH